MQACRVMIKTRSGNDSEKVICKMSLSNSTVAKRIEIISEDISSRESNFPANFVLQRMNRSKKI
ncbi:hypothetical protein HZS_6339 [Henneguya salminicola]|nr:hypothetical protein HZS_6339 [Henneguya salminicola]